MSIYKKDLDEAKERLKAWWDHEIIDRPCFAYYYFLSKMRKMKIEYIFEYFGEPWYLAQNWDKIDLFFNKFKEILSFLWFGGEAIPRFFPNYGPGIMPAVFGVIPKFQSNTVWFHKETSVEEIIPYLESVELNKNNEWYARLLRITEYIAKRAKKDFSVSVSDLGGVMDILSSFLGPTNIILTMKRRPEIIDTCRSIILEKLLKVYDDLQTIIERYVDGCNNWMPIWCPKRWYPIQSDFSAMLSPKYFKKFVLPDIVKQAESMDYAIYHLDGPGQLVHLDDLLAESSITGIQWVPGARDRSLDPDKWLPVYKKIQAAGKNIVVDNAGETPHSDVHLYKKLNPKGLFMNMLYLDKRKAYKNLPEFISINSNNQESENKN
jgi:5-methyltetrahydrofolate--homocysteine methyltransferase